MKTVYREWIGKRLKHFRETMNLSQAQLALKISMQKRSYGKYEEGHAEPSIHTFKKLCTIFGVSMDEFMKESPAETTAG